MKQSSIILKANDLYKYVANLAADPTITAVEVSIYECEDIETFEAQKRFSIDIVESGGFGIVENDQESLTEMTREEILDIE